MDAIQEKFYLCREIHHPWDIRRLSHHKDDTVTRELVCIRCKTERHDELWGPTGEVLSRRYVYAKGYLMQGDDRVDRQTVRRDLMRQLLRNRRKHQGRNLRVVA